MKFKNSFHPYAMVTILFWSLAYVLTRLTLQYFSAFSSRKKMPTKADIFKN